MFGDGQGLRTPIQVKKRLVKTARGIEERAPGTPRPENRRWICFKVDQDKCRPQIDRTGDDSDESESPSESARVLQEQEISPA